MDPYAFRAEFARLTTQLADSKLIEQRLQAELDRGTAQAARGDGYPPGYLESRWLLTRAQEATQKYKNQLDRVVQRRNEALTATIVARLKARYPQDVAEIERQTVAEFDLQGAAQ